MKEKRNLLIGGLIIGAVAIVLTMLGNPKNMGFCIACFIRDITGAVGLHKAEAVQYVRPEVLGLIMGSLVIALPKGEFKPRGGSSPVLRFGIGFMVMVGALMFLGCPFRMILRLAGGDLNALFGLAGFAAGILAGVFFLQKGFTLNRSYKLSVLEGISAPAIGAVLLGLLVAGSGLLLFSESGPGSMHAPVWASLAAGLAVGIIAQRTRLCMVGGIRDAVLFKDFTLLLGFVAILAAAFVGSLVTKQFLLGFEGQPVAHTDGLWNALGMVVVGFGSVLIGGCPLRQTILSGEGNSDSTIAVLGLGAGAAFCHNFGLASSAAGPTANGKTAVIISLVLLAVIATFNSNLIRKKA